MNFNDISQLTFKSGIELSNYIKGLAIKNGFKLYQHDSKSSNRIRFYCSNHQIHKNIINSNKIGCNFHLSFNKNINGIYVLSKNSNFEHSHKIENTDIVNIDNIVKEEVVNMKKIGISNFHIIMYIENKYNVSITRNDISKIFKEDISKISETEQLCDYMENKGNYYIYEDSNCNVAGIFTITYEEIENIKNFGDFLVIDGTTIPNFLEWTIIPISLEGNNMELLSGGIAFTSTETSEFYDWLINLLLSISPKLKCIISDEDSAICSSLENFPSLYHFLCIKHKISHIKSLINKNNKNIDEFYNLINVIFYSRCNKLAMESLNKLYELFPEVIYYFETNIYPNRYKLLVSLRANVFVFNHTSSQLAESYNNMIKRNLTNKIKHFWEIREHVSSTFRIKKNCEAQINKRSYISNHFIQKEYGIKLSNKVCNKLDIEIFYSEKVLIKQVDDNLYIAKESDDIQYTLNFSDCECHYPMQAGLPCRHIIALYCQLTNNFPSHFISKRLYLEKNNHQQINILIPLEEEEYDSDFILVEEEEEEYDDISDFPEIETLDIIDNCHGIICPKFIQNNNTRTELMQIAKEIVNIGMNPSKSLNVKNDLLKILQKYQSKSEYSEIIETRGKKEAGLNFINLA